MSNPITAEDIAIIREFAKLANKSGFNHEISLVVDYRSVRPDFNKGALIFIERVRQPEGFTPSETERRVEVPIGARNEVYEGHSRVSDERDRPVRFVASAGSFTGTREVVASLANVLRVGDEVRAHFRIGNNTDSLRAAGFTHDECEIEIYRKGKFFIRIPVENRTVPVGAGVGLVDGYYKGEVAA